MNYYDVYMDGMVFYYDIFKSEMILFQNSICMLEEIYISEIIRAIIIIP
jgi:hypothetical protein